MARRPWRDGFFVATDDSKPAEEWLLGLPTTPAAEVIAVVMAVRDAPPPTFAGGGKWEAIHGEMAGIYEVRCHQGGQLHRMFCLLDRIHPDGPALVMLDGDSKPDRKPCPSPSTGGYASTATRTTPAAAWTSASGEHLLDGHLLA